MVENAWKVGQLMVEDNSELPADVASVINVSCLDFLSWWLVSKLEEIQTTTWEFIAWNWLDVTGLVVCWHGCEMCVA